MNHKGLQTRDFGQISKEIGHFDLHGTRFKVDVGFLSSRAQTFNQSLVLHDITHREGPKVTH